MREIILQGCRGSVVRDDEGEREGRAGGGAGERGSEDRTGGC